MMGKTKCDLDVREKNRRFVKRSWTEGRRNCNTSWLRYRELPRRHELILSSVARSAAAPAISQNSAGIVAEGVLRVGVRVSRVQGPLFFGLI